MAFSSVGDRGKGLLALVEMALLSGKHVTLTGDGTCNGGLNVETLSEIYVE